MKKSRSYFSCIAENYDSWLNEFDHKTRISWFGKQLDRPQLCGEHVLDVGCGLGYFSRLVDERKGIPFALDIGEGMLAKAKRDISNCVQGNALKLPFMDGTFFLAISSECVEHTSDPLLAIREMVRVVRPGGYVMLTTPNHFWRWSVTVAEVLQVRKFEGVENWPKRGDVHKTLIAAGTEIVVDAGLYLFPFQFRALWPLLAWFNQRGQPLRRFMINQCWVARKL